MVSLELRSAWARKEVEFKEKVMTQFSEPITKNQQLTAYQINISQDGCKSDHTANTSNSVGTFVFKAELSLILLLV